MIAMSSQHQQRYPFCDPANPQLVIIAHRKGAPTTRVEHLLLLLTIVLLPMEEFLPSIGGFSSLFLLFAISSIYVIVQRFDSIARVWNHQVFLASYALIFVGLVLEAFSPFASHSETIRIVQMFIGAVIIATLCRDIRALQSCILGYILVGIWVSFYLFLAFYGALQGATATDFHEASQVRADIAKDDSLGVGLNALPFYVAQGVVAAMAMALMSRSAFARYSLFGIAALGLIASFLPLSRGGTAITLIACMAVMLAYVRTTRGASFQRFIRIIALMLGLGMCVLLWVPHAVFARLTLAPESPDGTVKEARSVVYKAALAHLPEYGLTGVGLGNFWNHWGPRSQFRSFIPGRTRGSHNCFIQITIYWGLPGLLSLIGVVYYAYKCLPKEYGNDPLSLAVFGVVVTLFICMLQMHSLAFKGLSLGFGILVAVQRWVWPAGETQILGRMVRKTLAERGTTS